MKSKKRASLPEEIDKKQLRALDEMAGCLRGLSEKDGKIFDCAVIGVRRRRSVKRIKVCANPAPEVILENRE